MLLIWDVHIYHKFADKIIANIRKYIDSNPNDDDIVFLGDFVYHFAYHRRSILQLFDLFVDLYSAGKNVYILSGNHDRLWENFVFAEGKSAFDVLSRALLSKQKSYNTTFSDDKNNNSSNSSFGDIIFITKPLLKQVGDEKVLFLPNSIFDIYDSKALWEKLANIQNHPIHDDIAELLNSKNKNEFQSGQINLFLAQNTSDTNLLVVHHHYIAQTSFPGIKSKFNYKDIAIHPRFLDQPNIRLLSGHLHQVFVVKNYFCTGSIWHTSPSELDHYKIFCKLNGWILSYTTNHINPYISLDYESEPIQKSHILKKLTQIKDWLEQSLVSNQVWSIGQDNMDIPDIKICNIQINADTDYQNIDNIVESWFVSEVYDFRLKKISKNKSWNLDDLNMKDMKLGESIEDWKTLLQDYLTIKFADQKQNYLEILQKLDILK